MIDNNKIYAQYYNKGVIGWHTPLLFIVRHLKNN